MDGEYRRAMGVTRKELLAGGAARAVAGCGKQSAAAAAKVVALTWVQRRIRASVTPYAEAHVRLGTSLHVDAADVDAALEAVKALQG